MALIQVSDRDFEEIVMKSKVPVLVDFYAEWSGPCRLVAPMLQELSNELDDRAVIVKVNVDESPRTAREQHIMSIPAMKLFKDGKMVAMMIGMQPKSELTKMIHDLMQDEDCR